MGRILAVGAVIASAAAFAPTGAAAATTVGSSLGVAADGGTFSSGFTVVQATQATADPLPITAPTSGVIVSVLFTHGAAATAAQIGLRIASGTYPNLTLRTEPRLPDLSYQAGSPPGTTLLTPADGTGAHGVPIAAGERLGIVTIAGNMDINHLEPGASYGFSAITGPGAAMFNTNVGYETLIQYVIEPDVDGDTYGDETQDQCPTDASTRGPCLKPVSTPVATGQRAAALASCKKRAHKHHWTKKHLRNCKKRANLLPV